MTPKGHALHAGLTARAFNFFQMAGWFGYYGYPNSARPWQNKQLWDWSHCCSQDVNQNRFFGLISALFGYTVGASIPSFGHFFQPVSIELMESGSLAFLAHDIWHACHAILSRAWYVMSV